MGCHVIKKIYKNDLKRNSAKNWFTKKFDDHFIITIDTLLTLVPLVFLLIHIFYIYVCMYVRTYVHIYVCVCVSIYIYKLIVIKNSECN